MLPSVFTEYVYQNIANNLSGGCILVGIPPSVTHRHPDLTVLFAVGARNSCFLIGAVEIPSSGVCRASRAGFAPLQVLQVRGNKQAHWLSYSTGHCRA